MSSHRRVLSALAAGVLGVSVAGYFSSGSVKYIVTGAASLAVVTDALALRPRRAAGRT